MGLSYLSLTLLLGVDAYAVLGWWWADPVGALAMIPLILWQGWGRWLSARASRPRRLTLKPIEGSQPLTLIRSRTLLRSRSDL